MPDWSAGTTSSAPRSSRLRIRAERQVRDRRPRADSAAAVPRRADQRHLPRRAADHDGQDDRGCHPRSQPHRRRGGDHRDGSDSRTRTAAAPVTRAHASPNASASAFATIASRRQPIFQSLYQRDSAAPSRRSCANCGARGALRAAETPPPSRRPPARCRDRRRPASNAPLDLFQFLRPSARAASVLRACLAASSPRRLARRMTRASRSSPLTIQQSIQRVMVNPLLSRMAYMRISAVAVPRVVAVSVASVET